MSPKSKDEQKEFIGHFFSAVAWCWIAFPMGTFGYLGDCIYKITHRKSKS